MVPAAASVVVLEASDDVEEPTLDQIIEYAEFIGIDPDTEPHLMWIAREGVMAPVPPPWKMCSGGTDDADDVFYFNFQTGESLWDHPCDAKYKELVELHRKTETGMAGLLSPETLCGIREAAADSLRYMAMPGIDEASCEDDISCEIVDRPRYDGPTVSGSSSEYSSDGEEFIRKARRPTSSSEDSDEQPQQDILVLHEAAVKKASDCESDGSDSVAEEICCESPRSSAASSLPSSPVIRPDSKKTVDSAGSAPVATSSSTQQLTDIQSELQSILALLAQMQENRAEQCDNFRELVACC